ncbi:alpha/beta fold hydrolase [Aliiroseovarius lamellibrachiae]|uniref:alpha/beta fold hydrolase n=1 Tax=Aliiroseovarius lamellibrachiae TaxID=1924933 RepID=UPI001BE06907|nr:alpha/beta fold hydrolase [Aliiroseovarius lamellibrachiae]MBT2130696.1 alpha/beta fold hydrolase [Aliiroseovarius lamellibrachiae]
MPYLTLKGHKLYYTDEGAGPDTIVFSHGLLFSAEMFEAQVAALKSQYRCITFDHRGQGKSAVSDAGYDMDTLAEDAAALIAELQIAPCHFVGLSMGGFVGMRLAIHKPELLKSLTLIETTADPEPTENHARYGLLNFVARWFGLGVVVGKVMPIMFSQSYLNDDTKAAERKRWRKAIAKGDRIGITRAVRGVIERDGVYDDLHRISLPTLIMVGEEDVATTPDKSDRMQAAIAGSDLITIPRAGHSSTIEQPEIVTEALRNFLAGPPVDGV